MIRCIAIDDEPLALEVMRNYISRVPDLHLLEVFRDPFKILPYLETNQADLLFIDIQMPGINGLQLVQSMNPRPLVIFTTAYSKYAVRGFDLEAIDYLLKPIRFERFIQALAKVRKAMELPPPGKEDADDFIFVKSEHRNIRIAFEDILYIEGLDDYVKIHLQGNSRPVLTLMSRKSLMEKLPRNQFMRVHRSYIVPIRLIRNIHNRQISLGHITIPVGETYVRVIHEWLSHH
jgi:two-component system, LytTR family, response regulator